MKVSINLRIRTADGKQPYCQPVWEGKRIKKLKPGCAIVGGAEEFHPEGVYHLSFYVGGKRRQESVGKNAVLAQRALERRTASEPVEVVTPAPKETRTLGAKPIRAQPNIFQSSLWLSAFLKFQAASPGDSVVLVFIRDVATLAEQSTLSPLSPCSGPPLFAFQTLPDNHFWHGSCLCERWRRGRRERLST